MQEGVSQYKRGKCIKQRNDDGAFATPWTSTMDFRIDAETNTDNIPCDKGSSIFKKDIQTVLEAYVDNFAHLKPENVSLHEEPRIKDTVYLFMSQLALQKRYTELAVLIRRPTPLQLQIFPPCVQDSRAYRALKKRCQLRLQQKSSVQLDPFSLHRLQLNNTSFREAPWLMTASPLSHAASR